MAKAPRKGRPAPKSGGKSGGTSRSSIPRKTAAPRPKAGGASYEIICSECYSSFSMYPASSAPAITCPECLHTGNVGAKDVMSKISIAKSTEKTNLMTALIVGLLFFVVMMSWAITLTSAAVDGSNLSAGVNYGFLGATLLLLIGVIWMGYKYEANRHEVYF